MIFLNKAAQTGLDYKWDFFNSDGSRAEMCGNGSRCAAWLAYRLGLAGKKHVFGTDAGAVQAEVLDKGWVRVQLTAVRDIKTDISLNVPGGDRMVHFANTGVPHAVVVCEDAGSEDVQKTGRAIRSHDCFAPAGANVNFIQIKDRDRIYLRTYERGVEDETYACGTGAAASAVVARHLGLCNPEVGITTSGGEELGILLDADRIFLSGPARLVYRGELDPGEFGL